MHEKTSRLVSGKALTVQKPVRKGYLLGCFFCLCLLFLFTSLAQSSAAGSRQRVTPPLAATTHDQHFGLRYIKHGLDVNDFRIPMTNYSIFGQFVDLWSAGGEWPKGSNEFYIYGAGIWVGGTIGKPTLQNLAFKNLKAGTKRDTVLFASIVDTIKQETDYRFNTDPRVVIGYNPSGGTEEFSGLTDIFISDHPEDHDDPDFWPLVDDQGDPLIVGTEDSYTEFDDQDPGRWDLGAQANAGPPDSIAKYGLGVKVILRTHSWNWEANKTIHFFLYDIVNVREDQAPIRNCFVSIMCDADIGPTADDDLVGFDHGRNLGYAYDSDFAEPGFDRIPGYLAYRFLESPVATYDVDLNGDDRITDDSVLMNDVWIKDLRKGEPLGLTSFKTSNLQSGDPDTEPEKYLIMAGHDYPDVGYQPYAPFDLGTGDTPVDQRFYQNTGPFLLAPVGQEVIDTVWYWNGSLGALDIASIDTAVGDTLKVVVAVMMAPDFLQLPQIADVAQSIYDSDWTGLLPPAPADVEIRESEDSTSLVLRWTKVAEGDVNGYNIYRSTQNGVYDDPPVFLAQPAADSVVFVDSDLATGSRYYYVVTSLNYYGESDRSPDVSAIPGGDRQPPTFTVGILQNPVFSAELNIYAIASESLKIAPTVTIGSELLSVNQIRFEGTTIWACPYRLNTSGTIQIEVAGTDLADNVGLHTEVFAAGAILPSGGNVVSHDNVLRLDVPGGAVSREEHFLIFKTDGQGGKGDKFQRYLSAQYPLRPTVCWDAANDVVSAAYSITPSQFKLKSQARLSFSYAGIDLGGREPAGLAICRSDGESWRAVPSYLDSDKRQVVAFIDELGVFQLRYGKAQDQSNAPRTHALENNYPNPFNNSTNISYKISSAGWVKIEIYNTLGQRLKTLVNEHMSAGRYIVGWDGTDEKDQTVSSGIYLYRLTINEFTETKKMIVLK